MISCIILAIVVTLIFIMTIFLRPMTKKEKFDRLKKRVQKKLNKRIKYNKKYTIKVNPRYDEVYYKGTEWLNKQ